MNKLKRKNITSTFLSNTSFLKKIFVLIIGFLVSTNVIAQVTFTSTPASSPRNAQGTTPDDGQAIASVPGLGGTYNWYWTDVNTGNSVQTTTNSVDTFDILNAASGTYALEVVNPDNLFSAKDTITITAPGTNFAIGSRFNCLSNCSRNIF